MYIGVNPVLVYENPILLWRKLKTPIFKSIITFSVHIVMDNVICVRLTKAPPRLHPNPNTLHLFSFQPIRDMARPGNSAC